LSRLNVANTVGCNPVFLTLTLFSICLSVPHDDCEVAFGTDKQRGENVVVQRQFAVPNGYWQQKR
jgi:hypothetical protein